MLKQIVNLSKKFISVSSTTENLEALRQVLEIAKKELSGFTIERFEKNGIPSLLIYKGETRQESFKIILNGHLDVVPANENQYKPYEKDGRLYGRGTYDMKAAAAVELLVFKELAEKVSYPLGLQLVTDEEVGGFNGTKYQIEKGVRSEFVIAGENTDLDIYNQAKGIIWAKLKTTGSAAHGAYPWLGDNAIYKMNRILTKIFHDYAVPKKDTWKTTINVAAIQTENKTFNKVPDNCEVQLDVRYIPEDKQKIVNYLAQLKKYDVAVDVLLEEPDHFVGNNNKYLKMLDQARKEVLASPAKILSHHGGSDLRHFSQIGCPGVEFGPKGQGHHTDNEWVDIESLDTYYKTLRQFLLNLS